MFWWHHAVQPASRLSQDAASCINNELYLSPSVVTPYAIVIGNAFLAERGVIFA